MWAWSLADDSNNAITKTRSVRVLSRCVTNTEIEELFSIDTLTNRSNIILECMFDTGVGNAVDTSGNNLTINHGSNKRVCLDSPYSLPKTKNTGFSLNGCNSGSYFINTTEIKTLLAEPVWTYTCWAKIGVYNRSQQIRLPYIAGLVSSRGLKVSVEGSNAYITLNTTGSDLYGSYTSIDQLIGNWILFGVEVNWTTKTYKLYLNGSYVKTETQSGLSGSAPDISSDATITFLRSGGITKQGLLKDFRFYTRELTPTEHRNAFLKQRITDGLKIEYTFQNDIPAGYIVDSSGNNLHSDWVGVLSSDYKKVI